MPPRNTISVTCAHCGKPLERYPSVVARLKNQFCDRNCQSSFRIGKSMPKRAPIFTVECAYCGVPIERRTAKVRRNRNHFCTQEHKIEFQKTKVETHCDHCGKSIQRIPSSLNKSEHIFCDNSCQGAYYSGKNSYLYSSVTVSCANCGKELSRHPWQIERNTLHYCDISCHNTHHGKLHSGENHPRWSGGGHTNYGPGWSAANAAAKVRDNFTCQYCGKKENSKDRKHDVHHVVPFRIYGIERHVEANQLSNLLTLCRPCHFKAEFGKITLQLKMT